MRTKLPDRRGAEIVRLRDQAVRAIKDAGLEVTPERIISYLCLLISIMAEKVSVGYARCGVSSEDLAAIIKTEREPLP